MSETVEKHHSQLRCTEREAKKKVRFITFNVDNKGTDLSVVDNDEKDRLYCIYFH